MAGRIDRVSCDKCGRRGFAEWRIPARPDYVSPGFHRKKDGGEGTAEVMLEHLNADTAFTESVFVVPNGNRWRFASYHMVYSMENIEAYQEMCDGSIPGSCGMRISGIKPWPLVSGNGDPIKP